MESKDAEKQCAVTFDQSGYTVISDRAYGNTLQPSALDSTFTKSKVDVGQELQTSYGSHSNDVLLCECTFDFVHKPMNIKYPGIGGTDYQLPDGFILQSNRFDYVPLDDLFGEHMMSSKDTESLEAAGYLG